MSVTVPSQADFDALTGRVALLETAVAGLIPPTPAPAPVIAPVSNEPAGYTVMTQRAWDSVLAAGWSAQGAAIGILTDLTAPLSPPNFARILYPAGFGSGFAPSMAWIDGLNSLGFTKIYLRLGIRVSANWQGEAAQFNKVAFVWQHGNPTFFPCLFGVGTGALTAVLCLQNIPAGARNLLPNKALGVFSRGVWHVWESLLIANTPGVANGIARWWLDGQLVGDYSDVQTVGTGQSPVWGEEVSWNPIWGGAPGDTVAAVQSMDLDSFYLSGAP